MIRIFTKRIAEVTLFLFFIILASFFIARLTSGDPVLSILQVEDVSVTTEQTEALREEMGFNNPLLVQFGDYIGRFVQLDFGTSYITRQPAMEMVLSALPATLELTAGALVVMLALAVPLGSLAALYRGRWIDRLTRLLAVTGAAIPSFYLGLLLIDLTGVRLKLLPTMGRDGFLTLILPSLTLGFAITSVYVRLLRSSLIDNLNSEFIRAARSRGLPETRIFLHALRNSLPPVLTVFGVSVGSLIGGVVVIEVIFAYPGIGKLAVESVRNRDYPVIQAYIFITAIFVFGINSAVDLVQRYLNPEIRLKERKHI